MIRNFTAKLYSRIKHPGVIKKLRYLEKSQWYSREKINSIQWGEIKRVIEHAYINTDFYRKKFDSVGMKPSDVKSPEDLLRIPILTRKELNENRGRMISKTYEKSKIYKNYTGGSTGIPVIFYMTKEKKEWSHAIKLRYTKWYGSDIGEPTVRLWGAERDVGKDISIFKKIFNRYFLNVLTLNTFDLTEKKIMIFNQKIKKFKPNVIAAYVSSAYLFSKKIKEKNIKPPNVKSVFVTAEKLHDFQRDMIEKAILCDVYNNYGSREFGDIASECPEGRNLHINAEHVFVEIVKNGKHCKSGEFGEILVTDLVNYGMPIIRYRIGDIGQAYFKKCICGRGLPLIKNISGRITDNFVKPDGGFVHGEFFTHLFYNKNGIDQFQVIQEKKDLIIIRIKKSDKIDDKILKEMEKNIIKAMGKVKIKFVFVEKMPLTETGKYRFTSSKISL